MEHTSNDLSRRLSPEDGRLLSRLSDAAGGGDAVAWRGRAVVAESAFRARVAGWTNAFSRRQTARVALFEPDGAEFAAALIGAWHARKTVYLPADTLPATCRTLATQGVEFAGLFPAECAPLAAPDDGDAGRAFDAFDADFPAVVIYTSGSTGEPQAVPKKISQLAIEVATLERQFGHQVRDAELFVATVSHQHIYGLLFKILWPLCARRPFLAERVAYPEQLAVRLGGQRSVLVASPAHLKRIPDSLDWAAAARTTCATFSSGGPLGIDAAANVERLLGRAPIEVYGSSETGGIAWRQRTGGVEIRWTPLPGVDVRTEGETFSVRSGHLANDAWFTTADRGMLHGDGTLALSGRVDRIVKVEGKRVSLTAMERTLAASSLVEAVRVLPLENSRELLGAIVVPSEEGWSVLRAAGPAAMSRALRTLLGDSTDRVALPRRWRWVDALPADSQGKVTQAELMRAFAAHEPTMPGFHLISRSRENAVVELHPPTTLIYFDGHFDDVPILPGVVQLDWAIELGRALFGFSGGFLRMEAVKFHRIFQPGPAMRVELDWRAERAVLGFRFSSIAGRHSSGRIFFAAE
jgi:acyl-CoA synthetase (AMP-forming)/AMP-acid ligase II